MASFNDRIANAAEGHNMNARAVVAAGNISAATTVRVPSNATIHKVFCDFTTGGGTVKFPNNQTFTGRANQVYDFDFHGTLAGGEIVITPNANSRYLITYVPEQ